MKNVFALVAFASLCVCCTVVDVEPDKVDGVTISVKCDDVFINPVTPATKTYTTGLSGGVYPILWDGHEQVSIFSGSMDAGGWLFKVYERYNDNQNASIIGNINNLVLGIGSSVTDFWGVYPYNKHNSSDGSSLNVDLPMFQEAKAGTFADDLLIQVGKSAELSNFAFKNVVSGFYISIPKYVVANSKNSDPETIGKEIKVREIAFSATGGETITGSLKIGWNDETDRPVIVNVNGDESYTSPKTDNPKASIFIRPSESVYFETNANPADESLDQKYFFIHVPTIFNTGITFTFYTDDMVGTMATNPSRALDRSNPGQFYGYRSQTVANQTEWHMIKK